MITKTIDYTGKTKPVLEFVNNVPKGHFVSGLISAKLVHCVNRALDLPPYGFYHVTYHYDKVNVNDVLTFIRVYKYLLDEQKDTLLSFTTTGFERFRSREHPDANLWSVKSSTKAKWAVIYSRWKGWEWQPHITDYNNVIHQNDTFNARFVLTFGYHEQEFLRNVTTLDYQRFQTVVTTLDKYL